LEEYFVDGETENIQREYEKLEQKYSKEKIIQKLIAKGFLYEEIRRVF
jgi:SOS response regulatory protein OraA/RecX